MTAFGWVVVALLSVSNVTLLVLLHFATKWWGETIDSLKAANADHEETIERWGYALDQWRESIEQCKRLLVLARDREAS